MLTVTLLGTGSPLPDPYRAGPSTLVSAGSDHYLVDAGRGALMRLAAAGLGAAQLRAVLLTHLHSDHLTDLNDVITTRWVTSFAAVPLPIVGPPGTRRVVDAILESLAPDISYRMAHHADLTEPPAVDVIELTEGDVRRGDQPLGVESSVAAAPTDHRPVEPTLAFRVDAGASSVVLAGDTVPCDGLRGLAAGAEVLVHTVIRKDLIEMMPIQRVKDTLDYHSSPEEAGATAAEAGVGRLVLTHYVPAFAPGSAEDAAEWARRAATSFDGEVVVGDDLHVVQVSAG